MKKHSLKLFLLSLLTIAAVILPAALNAAPPRRPMPPRPAPPRQERNYVKVVNEATFFNEVSRGVVLVDFYADWCPPCRRQTPIAMQAAAQMPRGARIIKVNVDQAKKLARKCRIRSIPTWIVFKNGREVERFSGLRQADFLINTARKHLR